LKVTVWTDTHTHMPGQVHCLDTNVLSGFSFSCLFYSDRDENGQMDVWH